MVSHGRTNENVSPHEQVSTKRAKAYAAIDRERGYQDDKWGSLAEHPHTVAEWLLIIESELAEAKEAWVRGKGDTAALVEIVQVAATAVACLEQHGAFSRTERIAI